MENKPVENNKKLIITLVVSIIFLIGIVAIGTFSFYTAFVSGSGNDNPGSSNINTVKLEATLTDGAITGNNLIPGDTVTKTFTVKNTGTGEVSFKLVWKSATNTFVNKNDLKITLKEDTTMKISESDNVIFPNTTTTETTLKDNLSIAPGQTKTYTLSIIYKNTDADQSADSGKSFSGKIAIVS